MSDKHSEISSFIWSVCDDLLRGIYKPSEYGDLILPFIVLRRLDCVLEPSKDKVIELYEKYSKKVDDPTPMILNEVGLSFYNHSKYDLQRLRQDHLNISLNFKNYLNGFSDNVREIIENFQLDKPVEKLIKNGKLYKVVETFSTIDLHPNIVDNHLMGTIFEELLRRFNELSNEQSGDHYTPRDEIKLLVSLVFSGSKNELKGEGKVRSIFDCCCGTGGILTIGKKWILENINPNIEINLFGQEWNSQTYSICKSDMLITGENPNNIRLGSSLSNDHFQGVKFDYLMSNVPFGVSWKGEQEFIENESQNPNGRFFVGTPRTSDGSLLFLQNMISKMEPTGSRIGVIFNGSPLFTGDSGSGESNIRKWIIENDWLECVVQLPDQLFFNTGITTYIWILSNNKKKQRKGKVQLIDGSTFYKPMKKSLGNKRKFIPDEMVEQLTKEYENFKETEFSKIFPNEFFGYTKVVIEQPLIIKGEIVMDKQGEPKPDSSLRDSERIPLLQVFDSQKRQNEIIDGLKKNGLKEFIKRTIDVDKITDNWVKWYNQKEIEQQITDELKELNIDPPLPKVYTNQEIEKLIEEGWKPFSEITKEEEVDIVDYRLINEKEWVLIDNIRLSDMLKYEKTDINEYYEKEVKPHLPNSWMDRTKDTIGYEINFTKYFYKYTPLRSLKDITNELLKLEKETDGLMNKLIG